MVSVERINQYCGITSEAPPVIENSRPAESWPTHGSIQFQRLQVYNPHFSILRHDISTIQPPLKYILLRFICLKIGFLFIDPLLMC